MNLRTALLALLVSGPLLPTARADLSNHWPLDETTGTTAPNAVAGGSEGLLFNGAGWVNDAARGQVLTLDGGDGYVDAGFLPALETTDGFTWSFWANSTQGPNNNVIVGNRYPDSGWIKFTTNAFELRDITPTFNATIDYPDFAVNAWVHHAVVKNGSLLTYFRNGVAIANQWITVPVPEVPFYLGGDMTNENWAGRIDDVATWTNALPPASVSGIAGGAFDPGSAPISSPPVMMEVVLSDDFSGGLENWTATDRGLENSTPAGYDAPSTDGGVLTLGGFTNNQYWYGSSVESIATFDSRLETIVSVDRVSLEGAGTARRASLWIFGDAGHYLHFAQNDGENGWQFNARDDGGAGTLGATGGGNNILGLDDRDFDIGPATMELRVRPGTAAGRITVEMWLDDVLVAMHGFTNFPTQFHVILTGQARATGDSVTAVFDNLVVMQEEVENLAPSFDASLTMLDGGTEGAAYASDIAPFATDPENDPLTFSKVSGPAWVAVAADGKIGGTPGADDIGYARFRARVEDPAGGAAEADFVVRVMPAMIETVFADDFSGDLSQWTITNLGLENLAPSTYDPPSTDGGELTLGGFTNGTYWYGSSVESPAFDSRRESFVSVRRVSIDGAGTAYRSSVWIYGDEGHFFHFSQNIGETGWSWNARDDDGTGTLNPFGGGNNIPQLDGLDGDLGSHDLQIEVNPTATQGVVNVYVLFDGQLVAEHQFTNFPTTFRAVLTGQARAAGDSVTAVFDDFAIRQEALPNNPPSFAGAASALAPARDGQPYSADLAPFATDPDGDPLTFSKVSGPDWINVGPDGVVGGTPGTANVGFAQFTAAVADPSGATAQAVFRLRVSPAVALPAGLAGWWPLNEGSGDIASDLGPGGNDGLITNFDIGGLGPVGEAWVEDPDCGMVLSFNGDDATGAFVTVGSPPDSGTLPVLGLEDGFSWSFWARQEQTINNDIILGNRYDATGVDFAPREFIKFTSAQFEWHWNGAGENIDYADIPSGVWIHHVAVKEGANVYYYRNGQLVGGRAITGSPINPQPLFFGGQGVENWRGYLSDIRTFTGALTDAEILNLFENKGSGSLEELRVTSITRAPDATITITWNSRPGATYAIDFGVSPFGPWSEADDGVPSEGSSTSYAFPPGGFPDPATAQTLFFRVREQ